MCGIAGIFSYFASAPTVDRDELRSIRDHMQARGPDGFGEWFSDNQRVALGHRRLSIIDLSERASQPMLSSDGRFVISFNGEIYNYRQLRENLQKSGRKFRTESDTEVLLQLYAEKGAAMLPELRGMFAFAIWDNIKQNLFLARDAYGIKPLYLANDGRSLRFASQVKALLQGSVNHTPEPAGHVGFFLWGSVPEPYTLFKSIRAFPPGHSMVIDEKGAQAAVAFCRISDILAKASHSPIQTSRDNALHEVASAVRESVIAHQVADVPVGVFLSAGIDSCLIATTAATQGANSHTLTLGFKEFIGTPNNEVPLAEEIARNLGAWHHTMMTSQQDFEDEREKLLAAMDQPSIDGVNTWFVARAAAEMDIKVALSGLGGDELFASYPSFHQIPKMLRYGKPFKRMPAFGEFVRRMSGPIISRVTSPKYAGLIEYSNDAGRAYLLRRSLHAPWELTQYFSPEFVEQGLRDLQTRESLNKTIDGIGNDRLGISALEMNWYMRNQLLRDTDWAGMAHSLEIRVPLLDLDLLRSTAPLFAIYPDIRKSEIAAVAAPQLPGSIINRPKTGFSVPVSEWIQSKDSQTRHRGYRGWAQHVYKNFIGESS